MVKCFLGLNFALHQVFKCWWKGGAWQGRNQFNFSADPDPLKITSSLTVQFISVNFFKNNAPITMKKIST